MKNATRVYVSVYFNDGLANKRKKRDVTLAFDPNDNLYNRCRHLGSSGIKRTIGIDSYAQLAEEAMKEDRSLGNYIKHHLRIRLENG